MDEREWLSGEDPQKMFDHVVHVSKVSSRKLLKFACACRWVVGNYRWDVGSGWYQWDDDVMLNHHYDRPPVRWGTIFLNDVSRSVACTLLREVIGNPFRSVTSPMPAHAEVLSNIWGWVYGIAMTAWDQRLPDGT